MPGSRSKATLPSCLPHGPRRRASSTRSARDTTSWPRVPRRPVRNLGRS
jgi:hypothetical protein